MGFDIERLLIPLRLEIEKIVRYLKQVDISTVQTVLDLGCGNGQEAVGLAFLLYPAEVVGISNDSGGFPKDVQAWEAGSKTVGAVHRDLPEIIHFLESRLRKAAAIMPDDVGNALEDLHEVLTDISRSMRLMRHDIQSPWPDSGVSEFDFVFSRYSFYHVESPLVALRNIRAMLSSDGVYLFHEPGVQSSGETLKSDDAVEWFVKAREKVGFSEFKVFDKSAEAILGLLK